MKSIIYGSVSTFLLTIGTFTAPYLVSQANAETTNPVNTCMKAMMYNNSPVTAGGQLVHTEISDMAAAVACQHSSKPNFSTEKVKSCIHEVMYFSPATSGGAIRSGISDIAAATACQNSF